jgi:hypothetical protein
MTAAPARIEAPAGVLIRSAGRCVAGVQWPLL